MFKVLVLTLGVVVFAVSMQTVFTHAQSTYPFTTSDPDNDTVKYEIEITGGSDTEYADPIIDFISDLGTPGETYFTLGQVAGANDTYVRGSSLTTLAPGTYIWRVKAFDNHGASSSFTDTETLTVTDVNPPPIVIDPPDIQPPPVVVDPPVIPPPTVETPTVETPAVEQPLVGDIFATEQTDVPNKSLLPTLFEHRDRIPVDGIVASVTTIGTFGSMIIAPLAGSVLTFAANASSMVATQIGSASLLNTLMTTTSVSAQSGAMGGLAQLALQPMHVFFLGWIPRRKKKPWGTVTSTISGFGVPKALVRLISTEFDRTVKQTITDKDGAYDFTIEKPGTYRVGVSAIGYNQVLTDVFHSTGAQSAPPNLNISLSPATGSLTSTAFRITRVVSSIQKILTLARMPLLIIGTVINIYEVIVVGDRLSWVVLCVYGIFWLFEYIIRGQVNPFGVVTNTQTHKPLARVIVRVVSLENNREQLVGTVVTGDTGQYKFLLAPGRYIITATLFGYTPYKSEILTFTHKTHPHLAIKLDPTGKPLTDEQMHDTVKMKEE